MAKLLSGLLLGFFLFVGALPAGADFTLGEKREFWVWDLNVMPPGARRATATAQVVGTRFAIFVEDRLWGTQLETRHLNTFYQALEFRSSDWSLYPNMGIVGLEEQVFRPLQKSISGEEKLVVLFADLGKYKDSEFDGFFNGFDRLPEQEAWEKYQQHSNELNMIYMNGLRRNETYTLGVISHELHHLLAPEERDLWYSEMLAEGAMLLNGYFTDQEHVNRYLQDTARFPLVTGSYVQYGPQILFAAYLMDQLPGAAGGLDELSRRSETNGRRAIEKLFTERTEVPSSFDAIYSNFLSYLFNASERAHRVPYAVSRYAAAGLYLTPIRRTGRLPAAPGSVEGAVAPYGFAIYDLDTPLSDRSNVKVERLGESPCAEGTVLWKPLSPKSVAVFAVGCSQQRKTEQFRYRLSVSEL